MSSCAGAVRLDQSAREGGRCSAIGRLGVIPSGRVADNLIGRLGPARKNSGASHRILCPVATFSSSRASLTAVYEENTRRRAARHHHHGKQRLTHLTSPYPAPENWGPSRKTPVDDPPKGRRAGATSLTPDLCFSSPSQRVPAFSPNPVHPRQRSVTDDYSFLPWQDPSQPLFLAPLRVLQRLTRSRPTRTFSFLELNKFPEKIHPRSASFLLGFNETLDANSLSFPVRDKTGERALVPRQRPPPVT